MQRLTAIEKASEALARKAGCNVDLVLATIHEAGVELTDKPSKADLIRTAFFQEQMLRRESLKAGVELAVYSLEREAEYGTPVPSEKEALRANADQLRKLAEAL
jgi:hypothetical protein